MSAECATVDVVIPTIGRPSLAQAVLAAGLQTWPETRVVVIADGPGTNAARIVEAVRPLCVHPVLFFERPERIGHGDAAREFWLAHADAAPFCKFVDDDDWIPPLALVEMMRLMADRVAGVACAMWVCQITKGRWSGQRIRAPAMRPEQMGCGSLLVRTESARGIPFKREWCGDFEWTRRLAERGEIRMTNQVLYWFNGTRRWAKDSSGAWIRIPL